MFYIQLINLFWIHKVQIKSFNSKHDTDVSNWEVYAIPTYQKHMMYAIAVVYGIYWDWFDKMCLLFHHELALLLRVSLKQTDDNALCYLIYLDKAILMSEHLICFYFHFYYQEF
jgi:hypothetical protein